MTHTKLGLNHPFRRPQHLADLIGPSRHPLKALVRNPGITELHSGKKKIQRTWRGMCYTMLCLENKEPSRENIRQYQAEMLGRSSGNTLLLELMPIPKPKLSNWDYNTLLPQFSSATDYYQSVKPQRIKLLQTLTQSYLPKVIVGYGKGFWPGLFHVGERAI